MCVTTLVILLSIALGIAESKPVDETDAESRVQQAMGGLFNYYWKKDPINKDIEFFFACAQIGEIGSPGQCTCVNPTACLECYRWWSAVALEAVATYGIYMNTTNHTNIPDAIFDHSPYNSNWKPENAFIDDFLWYGITYLRVHEWLKVSIATDLSKF